MKRKLLSILGVLVLSLSVFGGASASYLMGPPHYECNDVSALCGGSPPPPTKCTKAPCPLQ